MAQARPDKTQQTYCCACFTSRAEMALTVGSPQVQRRTFRRSTVPNGDTLSTAELAALSQPISSPVATPPVLGLSTLHVLPFKPPHAPGTLYVLSLRRIPPMPLGAMHVQVHLDVVPPLGLADADSVVDIATQQMAANFRMF